jgi:hypothetical protein
VFFRVFRVPYAVGQLEKAKPFPARPAGGVRFWIADDQYPLQQMAFVIKQERAKPGDL